MRKFKTAKDIKKALLRNQEVVINKWAIRINAKDEVEIWDPKGKGIVANFSALDRAVKDFAKVSQGMPNTMPKPVTYESTPSGSGPLGPDSTSNKPWKDPKVDKTPKPDGKMSDPSLGDDTTQDTPWVDPAINYRPEPNVETGGLPDTDLGPDSTKNPVEWEDKLSGPGAQQAQYESGSNKAALNRLRRRRSQDMDPSDDGQSELGTHDDDDEFYPEIEYEPHQIKNKGETPSPLPEVRGRRTKGFVDTFEKEATPGPSYQELVYASPSQDLLKGIADPDKWASLQSLKAFEGGMGRGLQKTPDGCRDKANKGMSNMRGKSPMEPEAGCGKDHEVDDLSEGKSKFKDLKKDKEARRRRKAGPKLKENWTTDGGYSRDIEAESPMELYHLTRSFGQDDDYDWSKYEPNDAKAEAEAVPEDPMMMEARKASVESVEAVVRPFIEQFMSKYEDLFDSDAGAHYYRDYQNYLNAWINDIAETVQWAEESGTGDVTGMETGYMGQLAEILFKLSPEAVSEEEIIWELEEAVDEVLDTAFEAASKEAKRAVDDKAKSYWKDYFKDYGEDWVKEDVTKKDRKETEPKVDETPKPAGQQKVKARRRKAEYLADGTYVSVPDVEITEPDPSYTYKPLRGVGYFVLVQDEQGVSKGFMLPENLPGGPFNSVKEWMASGGYVEARRRRKAQAWGGNPEPKFTIGDRVIDVDQPDNPLTIDWVGSYDDYLEGYRYKGTYDSGERTKNLNESKLELLEGKSARRRKAQVDIEALADKYYNDIIEDERKFLQVSYLLKNSDPTDDELALNLVDMFGTGRDELHVWELVADKFRNEELGSYDSREARRRRKAQAAPADPMESAPPGGGTPVSPETNTQTPPAAPGAQAPGAKPQAAPGAGDEGLKSLGWTPEDIKTMTDEDKQKILQVQLKKPGTGAPAAGAPAGQTPPKAPAKPAPQMPQSGPAPTPAAPGAGMPAPVAARLKRESKDRMKISNAFRMLAQAPIEQGTLPAAPQTAPSQPVQNGPKPVEVADEFSSSNLDSSSPDAQAMTIYSEILQKQVSASSPEQVPAMKAQELVQRLINEVGMSMEEAKSIYGLEKDQGFVDLFK